MDKDDRQRPSPASRRKGKFKPKPPPQRKPKLEANDANNNEEDGADQARKLMARFNENLRRKVPKVEKNTDVQDVFGSSYTSSTSLKTYGVLDKERKVGIIEKTEDEEIAMEIEAIEYLTDKIDVLPRKIKRDYREPWDYEYTYYPTTLPLRKPNSGDPEILDEAEFGDAAIESMYNESAINPASDLGLLEKSDEPRFCFVQVPPKLPIERRSPSAKGKEKVEGSALASGKRKATSMQESGLDGLPKGSMGKMVVRKSGAVKLKLGGLGPKNRALLYDVSPGLECSFAQDVVHVKTRAKECWKIGELENRAVVVTPNVDSLLKFIDSS